MKITKEIVELNKKLYQKDPNLYELMQKLAVLSVVAERCGHLELSKDAKEIFERAAKEIQKQ